MGRSGRVEPATALKRVRWSGVGGLLFASLTFFISVRLVNADPATVAQQARKWRAEHEREILAEFCDLLALPNLAADAPNIQLNAERICALLEKRGLTTRLLATPHAPPIVVADLAAPGAKRTIAFYA